VKIKKLGISLGTFALKRNAYQKSPQEETSAAILFFGVISTEFPLSTDNDKYILTNDKH